MEYVGLQTDSQATCARTRNIKSRNGSRNDQNKNFYWKGKWETHSCHQFTRIIKSYWKIIVETSKPLLVAQVLCSADLVAVALVLWKESFCPLSSMIASKADTGATTTSPLCCLMISVQGSGSWVDLSQASAAQLVFWLPWQHGSLETRRMTSSPIVSAQSHVWAITAHTPALTQTLRLRFWSL